MLSPIDLATILQAAAGGAYCSVNGLESSHHPRPVIPHISSIECTIPVLTRLQLAATSVGSQANVGNLIKFHQGTFQSFLGTTSLL